MKNINIKNGIITYYGNTAGYVEDGKAVTDLMFKTDELVAYLTEKHNLSVEWTNGVYDRLASGAVVTMNMDAALLKTCRIWQLKPETDIMIRFIGYDDLIKGGHGEPDPINYRKVYDGQIETNDLNKIYTKFNIDHPHGFEGHSLSMSDVVELYDESGSEFHYVDTFGFKEINFDGHEPEQENGLTMCTN